jgi:hypothetical protein
MINGEMPGNIGANHDISSPDAGGGWMKEASR